MIAAVLGGGALGAIVTKMSNHVLSGERHSYKQWQELVSRLQKRVVDLEVSRDACIAENAKMASELADVRASVSRLEWRKSDSGKGAVTCDDE